MTWRIHSSVEYFSDYSDKWDALNRRFLQNHPLGDSSFVVPLLKHFATDRDFFALHTTRTGEEGMLLLSSRRLGLVNSFCPTQTEICPVLISSLGDLQSLFDQLPLWTFAVQLYCQDPDYSVFPDTSSRHRVDVDHHAITVCIDLLGSFADYWRARPSKLQQSTRRSLRNLSKLGISWHFATVESPEEIQAAVDRYGDLESKGWKKNVGTAVHRSNTQGLFYRDMLLLFAERGKGVVYELYFDGRLVSSQLAIASDSMLITLKTTYDERHGKSSPGKLLDYMTLRHEFELGRFTKVEFCTNATAELIRWGTRTRPVSHITIYRNTFALRLARVYRWLKALKA